MSTSPTAKSRNSGTWRFLGSHGCPSLRVGPLAAVHLPLQTKPERFTWLFSSERRNPVAQQLPSVLRPSSSSPGASISLPRLKSHPRQRITNCLGPCTSPIQTAIRTRSPLMSTPHLNGLYRLQVPKPAIERTNPGLRPPFAAHVKR